jgi:hypothetical protein
MAGKKQRSIQTKQCTGFRNLKRTKREAKVMHASSHPLGVLLFYFIFAQWSTSINKLAQACIETTLLFKGKTSADGHGVCIGY